MKVKVILDNKELKKLEKLRYDVLGINDEVTDNNYHIIKVNDNKMLPFGLYNDNELLAGAYITDERESLYVDYIFVKKEYQEKGLHLGSYLLNYILKNKNIVEKYFNKELNLCFLEPRDEKSENIYKEMGFRKGNGSLGEYRRKI